MNQLSWYLSLAYNEGNLHSEVSFKPVQYFDIFEQESKEVYDSIFGRTVEAVLGTN